VITHRQEHTEPTAPSGGTAVPASFVVGRQVQLASQELPAAGAFTAQALQSIPQGTKRVTYAVTYTRGAAGGFPVFRHEASNGTETMRSVLQNDGSLVVTQPDGRVNVQLEELAGPQPADGTAITYELTYVLGANITATRLLVAEAGVVGTPGTIAVARTGDSGGAE
jgi:hypothetical protein